MYINIPDMQRMDTRELAKEAERCLRELARKTEEALEDARRAIEDLKMELEEVRNNG